MLIASSVPHPPLRGRPGEGDTVRKRQGWAGCQGAWAPLLCCAVLSLCGCREVAFPLKDFVSSSVRGWIPWRFRNSPQRLWRGEKKLGCGCQSPGLLTIGGGAELCESQGRGMSHTHLGQLAGGGPPDYQTHR